MNTPEKIQTNIAYIQEQLDSLGKYLPDTYQFLMREMDGWQRELMEHKLNSFYQSDHND
jgi:ABC-type phosphate transport system auxiliary subunit